MHKLKKHAVWLIVVAIIVGILLMFKSRKAVAEPSPQDITVELVLQRSLQCLCRLPQIGRFPD